MWTGAFGSMSRKATRRSLECTTEAGIAPEAIMQKRHAGSDTVGRGAGHEVGLCGTRLSARLARREQPAGRAGEKWSLLDMETRSGATDFPTTSRWPRGSAIRREHESDRVVRGDRSA